MSSREPEVSVVMSCYNAENHIRGAIESVLMQELCDFEFIIVNDGSTDKTSEILKEYSQRDDRVIVIDKKNTGLADSLNMGIKRARAKWIARMDADDVCLPSRLVKQLDYLKKHQGISILGSGAIYVNKKKEVLGVVALPTTASEICRILLVTSPVIHPTVMMNKEEILRIGGYDPKYRYCGQDYELWVRSSKAGLVIANMPDPLIEYTVDHQAKSFQRIFRRCLLRLEIAYKYRFPLRSFGLAFLMFFNDAFLKMGLRR